MRVRTLSVCIASILLLAVSVRADDVGKGTIIGTILDSRGNPVSGVIVVAQQAAQKMRDPLQATTNDKGEFKIEKVPEGEYNLKIRTADAKGKATRTVTVSADKTADVGRITLKSN